MHATIQIKLRLDKAQKLQERLDALKKVATAHRETVAKKLAKAKEEDRPKLQDALEEAEEVAMDMSMTNLLRVLVEQGMETLLSGADETLLGLLHAAQAPRGRPARGA